MRVNVTSNVECKLGKKSTSIRVQQANEAVPIFSKEGGPNKLVLTWPTVPESNIANPQISRAPLIAQSNKSNIANNMTNDFGNGYPINGSNAEPTRNGSGYNNNRQSGGAKHALVKPNVRAPPPPIPTRVESAY